MSAPPTVESIGEHGLIERIRARAPKPPAWVVVGIGDDAAVLQPERGEMDVLTTDGLVEGVHFRREWSDSASIGHKALAVNLSDLASMGASPRGALLSLALPPGFPLAEFDGLIDGFLALAKDAGVPLIGGNITRSPGPLMIDVTLVGSVRRRRVLTRAGGRPGDELYVTGPLGAAATGLAVLADATIARVALSPELAACVASFERPAPRLRAGVNVARNRGASACVDISDGLADALHRIAHASGIGALVDSSLVPVHAGTSVWSAAHGTSAVDAAIAGGEDYELLFAVPPRRRRRFHGALKTVADLPVTRIGRLAKEPGVWLDRAGQRERISGGFTHF